MNELTAFQKEGEERVSQVLEAAGLTVRHRRVMTGQMPHMTAPETALMLAADRVEIWLYGDEATFSTTNDDCRYERPDYSSEDDLLVAFLTDLQRALAGCK